MTVCIGAVCDAGKRVVVASDRMVTNKHFSLKFEGQSKIEPLCRACVVMMAGGTLAQSGIVKPASEAIDKNGFTQISQIVECVKQSFVDARKKHVEEAFLKPRGLSLDTLYGAAQKDLNPAVAKHMDVLVGKVKLKTNMIVAGVDSEGGHVYRVFDPGVAVCYDSLGYCAVGIGASHAESSLFFNRFGSKMSVGQAAYLVYEAKRRAECTRGVGKTTDVAIISDNIRYLTAAELRQLDEAFENRIKLETEQIEQIATDIHL